ATGCCGRCPFEIPNSAEPAGGPGVSFYAAAVPGAGSAGGSPFRRSSTGFRNSVAELAGETHASGAGTGPRPRTEHHPAYLRYGNGYADRVWTGDGRRRLALENCPGSQPSGA